MVSEARSHTSSIHFTGHNLRYCLTDVPAQPNSPSDNVLESDQCIIARLSSIRSTLIIAAKLILQFHGLLDIHRVTEPAAALLVRRKWKTS